MKTLLTEIPALVLQQITASQARHYQLIPYHFTKHQLEFYTADINHSQGIQIELELIFAKEIKFYLVEKVVLEELLNKYYRNESRNLKLSLKQKPDDGFLENLIQEGRALGSSDIHLEPYEEHCRIRFRIDGALIEKYQLRPEFYPALVNKIKIKSNLDIAEKRLPQDGRIFFVDGKDKFDIRVSTLPTLHGEKIVMRLLSNNSTGIQIQKLGFSEKELADYLEGVKQPNGIILVSGPTGSGKSTTLYATLQLLNENHRNILTIEDPIEYTLEGVNQVQLKTAIGLDFSSAMRTFLRQDPDIIMVGEIRDFATAKMAIRASLTGHLVLSTIHTNSAWGIISRLLDMGAAGYLIADTIKIALAQRLVRLLCPDCKIASVVDTTHFPPTYKFPFPLENVYQSVGCASCYFTGFRGRRAIYEVIVIDEFLRERVRHNDLNIGDYLKQQQIATLSDNAFHLLSKGITSVQEVYPILAGN